MIDCTISIDKKTNTITRHGIDPSKGEILDVRHGADDDDEEHEHYIAVKFASGKVWSGIGSPWRYYPASVTVYSLGKKHKDGTYQATALLHWDLGRKAKSE